jgi:hypothetical protein
MNDQRNTDTDDERDRSGDVGNNRLQGGVGAPTGLGQGDASGNPSGPRDANDPGSTRYGKGGPATGANEPKQNERKEQGDWSPRQGGDQSSGPGNDPDQDASPERT